MYYTEDISMNSQIFLRPPHEKTTQKTHNFGQKKNEKKALEIFFNKQYTNSNLFFMQISNILLLFWLDMKKSSNGRFNDFFFWLLHVYVILCVPFTVFDFFWKDTQKIFLQLKQLQTIHFKIQPWVQEPATYTSTAKRVCANFAIHAGYGLLLYRVVIKKPY